MFDFKDVSVDRPRFVGYGINHDVTIVGVESGNSQKGTEFIQLKVKNTGDNDDNSTILKMYFSEKAEPITKRKILNIHSAVAKVDLLTSKTFSTTKELAAGLDAMWAGKRFRLKLQGSEYVIPNEEGKNALKTRTEIPISRFAEAIMGDAEKAPVADADTKLTWDKEDSYDFRRLTDEEKEELNEDSIEEKGKDGLPF